MTPRELIGRVAASYLRRELAGSEDGGTARYVIDGLGLEQTAAVARAVLADTWLAERVAIRLPLDIFAAENLPDDILTVHPATVFRDAECDRLAYLVTSVGEDGEGQSLQDLSRLGGAELLERLAAWVEAIDEGLGLDEEARIIFERALNGLAQLRATSLDRFAAYALRVRHAVEIEGHPLIDALGAALPALRLPNDPKAFAGIKERSRRHTSAWQREFSNLFRRRRGYLLKETPSQLLLNEDELRAAFAKSRDVIPEDHHAAVERFIGAHPGWNEAAAALAECDWEQIKPLFEGLVREKFNLGAETLRYYAEGEPGLLSSEDEEYLRLLAIRNPGEPDEDDIDFYEAHREELGGDRKLRSAWDKLIYGKARETLDFLAGIAAAMESFALQPGANRKLRIRCDKATKRDLRGLNVDAGEYFALRYAGLQRLLGPQVELELGHLLSFPELVESWRRDKVKGLPNRSTAKAAYQLRFHLDFETETATGSVQTTSTQLIWRYDPKAISSQFVDDWSRLEAHPFTAGRTAREPAIAGRRAGAIDLADVRTLVPAYDRDRGSLLPAYRKERDLARFWPERLAEQARAGLVSAAHIATIEERFRSFEAIYAAAIARFRTDGPGAPANRGQAADYAQLLDALIRLAPGDRNREALLRPLMELGTVAVDDGDPAAIVAPWHPLRLAAMWRKAQLVASVVRMALSGRVQEGDTRLYFRDLAADLAHPLYPEVVVSWTERKAELLSLVDARADYSLHETPVWRGDASADVNDDPAEGAQAVLDLVRRYLALHPHERANMSVVLFNCDSARLPQQVVQGMGGINDDAEDVRCQVLLRHVDPARLRELYRSILMDDEDADAYSASEATQDFMARLRISVIADEAPPPDPRDGRPYDIVFSQDVISRHAALEWHAENARPADLETLLPARWSRRRPASADDLKSAVYLCCPVQSLEGWSFLSAATTFLKGDFLEDGGRRLLPTRQLDFHDPQTARIFSETHDLGAWVVNYDELLDRRQLRNQNVRVIRYKQSATQGRNVVISSQAPLGLLRAMVRSRLADLNLGIGEDALRALADKLIDAANDVSGDIVLRAAKRGEAASELIGVVLSRYLANRELGTQRQVGWYFLDDYAAWLGAREETQADILALAPREKADGRLELTILVTEAKYVSAGILGTKRKESARQVRDTVKRIREALLGEGERLDREAWRSRLADLVLDGIQIPAASPVDLGSWRRAIREGACDVQVRGYSHVFVPTAGDGASPTDVAPITGVDGCEQEVFGRADLKRLLMAFAADEDPTPIRVDAGSSVGIVPVLAPIVVVPPTVVPDEPGTPDPEANPAPTLVQADPPGSGAAQAEGIEQIVRATLRLEEEDDAWLVSVAAATRSALQQLSLQAKSVGQTLTPNSAILRFAGSANLTVDQVNKKRSELLTTFGLNVISVRPEPGVVAVAVARPKRRLVTIEQVWDRWAPQVQEGTNQDIVIGIKEEDNSLLTFSPGNLHAPHTLIAGSTGSGKSVLMQSILLGLAATNTPQQARIILIDPKQGVDYFAFDALPHLDGGVVDTQEGAIERLEALVAEMERRYRLFREQRANGVAAYNAKVSDDERLPVYWVIHDEFADWMLTDEYKAAVTSTVGRLGVKARAAGIHLIFAAQRPEANVMPMQLRSQLGNRLILRVDSEGTSEIALGEKGAERLLGRGHLIAKLEGEQDLIYAQVPFSSPEFIEAVVEHLATRWDKPAIGMAADIAHDDVR
ncbi:FtsK/SpoIIIE domain-containing protein [Novosphingobium aquiterrae]|uniref:FtsK/SpoIIIE domain-containing protein n=1 Tax=Novosphingobium aquiterrae TaxID=624388 RepID=A0ABV6PIF3_9SPHN